MSIWSLLRPAAPAPTPSDAARILSAVAADQRAARIATTDALRADVAAGRIAPLGWKH